MEKPQLFFKLIQNMNDEYPQFLPYSVIKLVKKGDAPEGFSCCDEYGRTDYMPGLRQKQFALFRPYDENTKLAFLGEQIINKDGIIFLKIIYDEEVANDLIELSKEFYSKEN